MEDDPEFILESYRKKETLRGSLIYPSNNLIVMILLPLFVSAWKLVDQTLQRLDEPEWVGS